MRQISEFTNDARQHHVIVLDDNSTVDLTLQYCPRPQAWYFDLIYKDIKIYGCQIVNGYRLLRQWKNLINFDFMVQSLDGQDPFLLSDFVSGRTNVFLLNSTDIAVVEQEIYYE